jgi:hypothetical protein
MSVAVPHHFYAVLFNLAPFLKILNIKVGAEPVGAATRYGSDSSKTMRLRTYPQPKEYFLHTCRILLALLFLMSSIEKSLQPSQSCIC